MSPRYAIFFASPPESLLWRLGCIWHGRDPATGAILVPRLPDTLTRARHEEIVRPARHYGFHATLKPPFALKPGMKAGGLEAELDAFARNRTPFLAPALQVSRIRGFVALILGGRSPEMEQLCAECVETFDSYRAPEPPGKLAERRAAGLTARQEAMLVRWGYPYVMEEFRFHMTLTTHLKAPEIDLVERHLHSHFRSVLASPLYVDRVMLFEEPPGEDMRVRRQFLFGRRA